VIALTAASPQETFEQTIRAFNLAETYMMPVILLIDEITGHTTEKVVLPDYRAVDVVNRKKPSEPPETYLPYRHTESCIPVLAPFGSGYRYNVTGLCHNETGFPTNDPKEIERLILRLTEKVKKHRADIIHCKRFLLDDAEIAVFAYGSVARSARQAVRELREQGIKAGLLEPTVLWPFPSEIVLEVAERVSSFVVAEMNLGQMAREVELASKCRADIHRLNRIDGDPISPPQIVQKVMEVV
jgi:2-oxoglutarate ferredoxin oxidoreductase subunit alpha